MATYHFLLRNSRVARFARRRNTRQSRQRGTALRLTSSIRLVGETILELVAEGSAAVNLRSQKF